MRCGLCWQYLLICPAYPDRVNIAMHAAITCAHSSQRDKLFAHAGAQDITIVYKQIWKLLLQYGPVLAGWYS